MPWTTPRDWTTSELVTETMLDQQISGNFNAAFPLGVDAWTGYTPTLTQSGAVAKTVTYARYQRVGRLIVAQVLLAVTGTGTVSTAVFVGLPVTAATSNSTIIGSGKIVDASAGTAFRGIAEVATSTTAGLLPTSSTVNNYLGATDFTAALASSDTVSISIMYEAAS